MNQKKFLSIALIVLVVVLISGALSYFIWYKKSLTPLSSTRQSSQSMQNNKGIEKEIPADLREIVRKTTELDSDFISYAVDLNKDNVSEFMIRPGHQSLYTGASGNTQFFVYQKLNTWKNIGRLDGNMYEILDASTNAYNDIKTNFHKSASESEKTIYKWNGLMYVSASSEASILKTYRNTIEISSTFYSFEIRYPSSWTVEDRGNNNFVFKNKDGNEIVSAAPHLRNLDYDYQNTLEKDIQSSAGQEYMATRFDAEKVTLEKIVDDETTLGYFSQWIIFHPQTRLQETRADFESKLVSPSIAPTGKYKTVISFVAKQNFTDISLFKLVVSTFKFTK